MQVWSGVVKCGVGWYVRYASLKFMLRFGNIFAAQIEKEF